MLSSACMDMVRSWNEAGVVQSSVRLGAESQSAVMSCAWFEDQVATGGDDGFVRVYNSGEGKEARAIAAAPPGEASRWLQSKADILSLAFSPSGDKIVTGGKNGAVLLWDAATGRLLHTLSSNENPTVRTVAFSSTGELVAAPRGGAIRVWDATTGTQIALLRGHDARRVPLEGGKTGFVPCECSLPRSPLAAVRLSPSCRHQGHLHSVLSLAFSPSNTWLLASASQDATVRLWDVLSGSHLRVLEGHSRAVNAVTFGSCGTFLLSGSDDTWVRVSHVETGEALFESPAKRPPYSDAQVVSVAVSPGSTFRDGPSGPARFKIAAGCADGFLVLLSSRRVLSQAEINSNLRNNVEEEEASSIKEASSKAKFDRENPERVFPQEGGSAGPSGVLPEGEGGRCERQLLRGHSEEVRAVSFEAGWHRRCRGAVAFAMALHPRLGVPSAARALDPDLVRMVLRIVDGDVI